MWYTIVNVTIGTVSTGSNQGRKYVTIVSEPSQEIDKHNGKRILRRKDANSQHKDVVFITDQQEAHYRAIINEAISLNCSIAELNYIVEKKLFVVNVPPFVWREFDDSSKTFLSKPRLTTNGTIPTPLSTYNVLIDLDEDGNPVLNPEKEVARILNQSAIYVSDLDKFIDSDKPTTPPTNGAPF